MSSRSRVPPALFPQLGDPPIQAVDSALLREHDVRLNVLRLDLLHPIIHGNKWFKLKYNLSRISASRTDTVLSFGGPYSNHICALAAACRQLGLSSIGVIRGELVEPLNPVLRFASEQGMKLVAMDRASYRRKHEPDLVASLRERFGVVHILPEGGSNALALIGCAEIAGFIRWQSSSRRRLVALACATGATMAGLVRGLQQRGSACSEVLGVSVLKAEGYPASQIAAWLDDHANRGGPDWDVLEDYHCGGFGRSSSQLQAFLKEFRRCNDIPLEPVYTGKLFYGLLDVVASGRIPRNSEILALHTGGVFPGPS